ncbi:hypothetical protein ACWCQL_20775 [Streptomyces sp. NPDC002073]
MLLVLALLCAAAVTTACSSDEEPRPPESSVETPADVTPVETPTQDSEEEEREQQERESNGGNFNTAGRLSDNFDGNWPDSYIKFVTNPSDETYVGTVSVVDCTPGEPSRPLSPPSQSVTVPPGGDPGKAEFKPPSEGVTPNQPRHMCVTLSDAGGVRDTGTDVMSVPRTEPEPEPDTSPPDPGPDGVD